STESGREQARFRRRASGGSPAVVRPHRGSPFRSARTPMAITRGRESPMLRGLSTLNLFAEDLPAATRWYTEALGVKPYFTSEAAGRGPGYVEFRIGDYQHELGVIDRRFAPPGLAAGPGGAIVYWHVDDVAATLDRLGSLGAKQLQWITERGPRFVTASAVAP